MCTLHMYNVLLYVIHHRTLILDLFAYLTLIQIRFQARSFCMNYSYDEIQFEYLLFIYGIQNVCYATTIKTLMCILSTLHTMLAE